MQIINCIIPGAVDSMVMCFWIIIHTISDTVSEFIAISRMLSISMYRLNVQQSIKVNLCKRTVRFMFYLSVPQYLTCNSHVD